MTTYTNIFGGNTVLSADQSLTVLALTANLVLSWPADGLTPSTSAIVEVTPDIGGRTLRMPDARNAGNGETVTFRNYGAFSFSVQDNIGGAIVTIGAGGSYTVYLRDNSTQAGSWAYWQAGAGSSVADAGALQGAGLDALSGLLRVKAKASSFSSSQAFADGDRGGIATWTGGSGTFSMPKANSVGNGWYMIYKNGGSGTLQIAATNSETFDGNPDITLASGEGATVISNGTNFTYVKHGASATAISFSYSAISVAGTGTYTLSAAEYAKTAISFTGLLTGNRSIVVPTSLQNYYIVNNTTGAFTLTVKTAAGTGVAITQTKSQEVFCDGTNVVAANTDYPSGLGTPISIANGGTGQTTAGAALTALGGTTTGVSLFTSASGAAARSALSGAASGANTDITSIYVNNAGLKVRDVGGSFGLTIKPGSTLTADRILTITSGDAARTLDISASDVTITAAGAAITAGVNAAAQRTTLGLGSAALLTAGTAANNAVQLDGSAKLPAVDGSQLTNISGASQTGRLLRAPQILTSGTSYTTPAGCNSIYVECVGGGGYGGAVTNNAPAGPRAGGGGGAAAYCAKLFSVSPSTAYSYAIGAGGIASTTTNGTSTTFTVSGTTITAGRGLNGNSPSTQAGFGPPGGGGTATNGDINATGNPGGMGSVDTNTGCGGPGGGSFFGGGGLPTTAGNVGGNGVNGGGGSGASSTGTSNINGGNGGAGIIRVWEYA